ncbi:MAG: fasciclin domain-containing protein [Anaerolineae bacterium]|nr:fasciclin domain-containing protein [Anaerolineae bacterium]
MKDILMQRAGWLIWIALLLTIFVPQAATQPREQQSLLQRIQQRADLSTFATFVAASYSDIPALLDSDPALTVFAPNNAAFSNLASLLEIPLTELLQNPEVISQIVRYHIFSGVNNAAQLRNLDGSVVPTLLQNAFVAVRVRDNVVTLNNVVSVVQADIPASNGVLHIVDDVLLNRVIVETLNNPAAEEAITPNPTPMPATAAPSPTPLLVNQAVRAGYVRFANLLPGVDLLQVTSESQAQQALQTGTLADFVLLPAGVLVLTLSAEGQVLAELPIQVAVEQFQTVLLVRDSLGELRAQTVIEDYSATLPGESRVTLVNALDSVEGASVFADGAPLLATFAPGATALVDLPAAEFAPVFNLPESSLPLEPALRLQSDVYTFVALYGTLDDPRLLVQSVQGETMRGLQSDLQRTNTDVPSPSIAQILADAPDFSFLAEATHALEEPLRERIAGTSGEPLTLLAPTNAAFADLLVTIDRTSAELLNDTELLRQILLYHMLEGQVLESDFRAAQGTSIVTLLPLNEAFFITEADDGRLLLNGLVNFVQTDIRASNGIIHIIDEVLLPRPVIDALGL